MSADNPTLPERVRAEARHVAQSLRTFGPARGKRWPLALQAALAMTVPIVVLAALGYDRLALLAATGAFTVIYGGWLRPRERARFAPLVSPARRCSPACSSRFRSSCRATAASRRGRSANCSRAAGAPSRAP